MFREKSSVFKSLSKRILSPMAAVQMRPTMEGEGDGYLRDWIVDMSFACAPQHITDCELFDNKFCIDHSIKLE